MRGIEAVAVVVPARDEEDSIENCLSSVHLALRQVPAGITTVVSVILDRCVDRTPQLVEAMIDGWPGAVALHVAAIRPHRLDVVRAGALQAPYVVAGTGVGALRDLGVRDALERLRPRSPGSVWLLHTDADTVVPQDWVVRHLAYAADGVAGVAGTVELTGPLSGRASRQHDLIVLAGTDGERHEHVYGANLGVRGDAYLAVGGFPFDGPGEDRGLWDALHAAGRRLSQPVGLRVRTSARTAGRATGGLADLLSRLDDELGDDMSPAG